MCGFFAYEGDQKDLVDFEKQFEKLRHRGPDDTKIENHHFVTFGFHRLAIMDLSHQGDQPFHLNGSMTVCNGEIYNYKSLKNLTDYQYHSGSDCEVILPIYEKFGLLKTADMFDGEYAFVIWDAKTKKLVAARDPMGIRPMFYGTHKKTGKMIFASEMKSMIAYSDDVKPFPPGHVWNGSHLISFHDSATRYTGYETNEGKIYSGIHDKLVEAVRKRMVADAPVGFLLSGGLDSSLVCSIAAKMSKKPIKTFAIGMTTDAIDLKYAKIVADHLGADHTEIFMTKDDVISAIREVICALETYDITTVRASLGMYLICKGIKATGKVKVLLTGEVSDELFGYKYTDFAPSAEEFQKEAQKRVKELYMYDVLRADRCISAHSIEARVPFSDKDFIEFVMAIDPTLKMNTTGKGKYLLRKAFDHSNYLPDEILWREKAAFSDAVGHSMVDYLKAYAEEIYTDEDFKRRSAKYKHATPFTKESLLYRDIFEEFYAGKSYTVADFWMPNKTWEGCNVNDPSARVLKNYGASGT